MDNIKIVRFKDAIDVICTCVFDKKDYAYDLYEPMMFDITQRGQLVLQHWLPLAAIKGTSVSIRLTEIVCIMEPNDEFAEYYEMAVNKLNSVVEPQEEDGFNDIINAMDELENIKGTSIH